MPLILNRGVDWSGMNPAFRTDVEALFGSDPATWYVTYAFRTRAVQDTLYKKFLKGGPKAAPPGKSPHEFGLAIDFVLDVNDLIAGLQPSWDDRKEAWIRIHQAIEKHPRLKHGKTFGDGGHVERLNWSKYKNWSA